MTDLEAGECLKLLLDLFPQADLKSAELDAFRGAIAQNDKLAAIDAMRNHRLACRFNRPSFAAILADLDERKRKSAPLASNKLPKTFAQIIRAGNPNLAHKSDAELVLGYHRHWWVRCGKTDDNRKTFVEKCRLDLIGCGVADDVAARAAAFVIEDQRAFEMACDDLRNPVAGREVADYAF